MNPSMHLLAVIQEVLSLLFGQLVNFQKVPPKARSLTESLDMSWAAFDWTWRVCAGRVGPVVAF